MLNVAPGNGLIEPLDEYAKAFVKILSFREPC
jgi:hypothetical protein